MNPNSSAALRFGQRTQISGAPGLDLESLSTYELPNGCEVVVDTAPVVPDIFILVKTDNATVPNGNTIVAPVSGPGRWFRYSFLNGDGSELKAFPITFVPNPILATTSGDSTPAVIFRQTPGRVLVIAQYDLSDTVDDELITVQGLVDGVPTGQIARYQDEMAFSQTFGLTFLASFAVIGVHGLQLRVTAGATGNVTVANAVLLTVGQV